MLYPSHNLKLKKDRVANLEHVIQLCGVMRWVHGHFSQLANTLLQSEYQFELVIDEFDNDAGRRN